MVAGITFRQGVTLAIAPGSGSGPPGETLNPGTDPNTGNILILGAGCSNSGGFPTPVTANDSFGGTWSNVAFTNWGSRRTMRVDINDSWTTASGSVDIQYNANQSAARVMMIVEGASNWTERDELAADAVTNWTPNVGTLDSAYLVFIQMEGQETISTSSTGWTKIGEVDETAGVRTFAIFTGDASVGGFDSTPTFSWTNANGFAGWAVGFTT